MPTHPRKKLTVASLIHPRTFVISLKTYNVWNYNNDRRGEFEGNSGESYRTFLGLMIKHHLVQIAPVAVKARFCVRERFSAGRERSLMPAMTRAHYEFY